MNVTVIQRLDECLCTVAQLKQMMIEDEQTYQECMGGELMKAYLEATDTATKLLNKIESQLNEIEFTERITG